MSTASGRHRATDAVARSEARFRALIQYLSDVLTLLDPTGTVLYNAPAVQAVLGWDADELIGRKAFDFVHPDDLAHVGAAFGAALQQPGVAVPVTFRFRHRDGRWIYLEAIGSNRLDDPNVRGVVVNSRDLSERMRVEERLRKTQQLHELLIEQVPVGILFTDPAGQITSANPAALAILGSPSEAATKQFNVLTMDPLQRAGVSAAYQRVLQTHGTERVELPYRSVWGRRADLRLVIAPLYDHPGRLLGTVSIVEDLTDRTRADREKVALLEIARDISGTLDKAAILDRVHERAAALLPCDVVATWLYDPRRGLRAVAQHGLPEAIAAEAQNAALERGHPLVEALAGGQTVVINDVEAQPWLPREGLRRLGIQAAVLAPLIVRGVPTGAIAGFRRGEAVAFTGNEVQLFEGIARQVALMLGAAALHRAEQEEAAISTALARVGRELISAVSSPTLLAQLCAVTARVLECDRAHTLLFEPRERVWRIAGSFGDSPEEEISGRAMRLPDAASASITARLEHDDVTQVDAALDPLIASVNAQFGISASMYMALRRGDEIIGVLNATYRGSAAAFSPRQERIARGIAQLASLALEDARLVEELNRANTLKSEFVATMSHELRTPLNIILGYHSLLLDGTFGPLLAEQQDSVERADRNARALLELISATLDLSRLESGQMPIDLREFALADLLHELDLETRDQHKPGVSIDWAPLPVLPPLYSDAAKIKVVLKNLIGNALKFTDQGRVTVAARPARDGVEISVSDTGAGIAADLLAIIFEPFRQAAGDNTRQHGGVGLGLYIVRRLLHELGGTVEVDSVLGAGTTFRVWVPPRAA